MPLKYTAILNKIWQQIRPGLRRRAIMISLFVGVVSGAIAFLVFAGLEHVSFFCTRVLMGVDLQMAAGERIPVWSGLSSPYAPLLVLVLPAIGGLLSGLLTLRFSPDAGGDGVDATIKAFHEDEGRVPPRVALVKTAASVLTIGSGGSAGQEGPVAQVCACFGAWFSDLLRLSTRERRTYMLAGMAAGIGAIFRTPLGGAVSAVEVLYKEDFESTSVVPCMISSVSAYTIFCALVSLPFLDIHSHSLFAFPDLTANVMRDLGFYLIIGLACALVGRMYVASYRYMRTRTFPRLLFMPALRPFLGGLAVGAIALVCAQTLGNGHGLIQMIINWPMESNQNFLHLGAGLLLLLFLKIFTTSLTLGSGGSGGIFGPTLIIGGLTGATTGAFCHALLPALSPPPVAVFVVLGMAGLFSGVASATIGAVIMVCEMTGSYSLLAPLLIVVVITVLIGRGPSIYENQVTSRFQSPVYRRMLMSDLLSEVQVNAFYHRVQMPTIHHSATTQELRRYLADENVLFPLTVVNDAGTPCGMLTMGNIRPVYFDSAQQQLFLVRDMATALVTCSPEDSLASVLRKFEGSNYSRLPVISKSPTNDLLGYIQYQDIMIAYETEIARRRLNT